MKESKNQSFIRVLLSAGLLSFIGGIVTLYINVSNTRALEEQKFQNELVKQTIQIKNNYERVARIKLLYATGLLDSCSINEHSLIYLTNYERGMQDRRNEELIVNSIRRFYSKNKRVPSNFSELVQDSLISEPLGYFEYYINYIATGPEGFQLRFPGADSRLLTQKDNEYNFDSLKINN